MSNYILRRLGFALVIAVFLASCASFAPSPVPGPTVVSGPTNIFAPTLTSAPSATLVPTSKPTPTSTSARFEPAACKFQIVFTEQVECGYLVVPEDHSQANSRTIRLHVAIVKSRSKNPAPDPVVYLHGGPGSGALNRMTSIVHTFSSILNTRDLIVFDQRGVGFSEPSLDCPEVDKAYYENLGQATTNRGEMGMRTAQAYTACRERLKKEGINLDAYNSAISAADVNDLRTVLGYDKVNLYGISYGTRLALTMMRDFPSGIRSVILDSTLPLQVDLYAKQAVNTERSLNLLFDRCAADARCNSAYPKLRDVFYDLVARLYPQPIRVDIANSASTARSVNPATYSVLVDGGTLISGVRQMLYSASIIPYLPKMIFDVDRGDYALLRSFGGYAFSGPENTSEGMARSVVCSEEMVFYSIWDEEIASAHVQPGIEQVSIGSIQSSIRICDIWNVKKANPIAHMPVVSSILTLVLAGEYDPVTPPSWGKLAATTLSQSYYYESPNTGHGVLGGGTNCARQITSDFLDDPTKPPGLDCYAGTYSFFFVP